MSIPIAPVSAESAALLNSTPPPPTPTAAGGVRFAEVLAAPQDVGQLVLDAAREMSRGQRRMDRAIHRAQRGQSMEPAQLLALQAGVYRTTQELELASKLVDKATGAIKQTLQSQR